MVTYTGVANYFYNCTKLRKKMQKRAPIISNSLVRAGSDGRNKNAEMFKTKEPNFNIVELCRAKIY